MGWKGSFADYLAGLPAPNDDAARAIGYASDWGLETAYDCILNPTVPGLADSARDTLPQILLLPLSALNLPFPIKHDSRGNTILPTVAPIATKIAFHLLLTLCSK